MWRVITEDLPYDVDGSTRRVSGYRPSMVPPDQPLPTLYCSDGQAYPSLLSSVSAAILESRLRPLNIVAVNCSSAWRGEEYLGCRADDDLYARHEQFFLHTARVWAESRLAVSDRREDCGVFGFSNGGAFAVTVGSRHPDSFGFVIAFSVAKATMVSSPSPTPAHPLPHFYLAAGKLGPEKMFRKHTQSLARRLLHSGHECEYVEREGGHGGWWGDELARALERMLMPRLQDQTRDLGMTDNEG